MFLFKKCVVIYRIASKVIKFWFMLYIKMSDVYFTSALTEACNIKNNGKVIVMILLTFKKNH